MTEGWSALQCGELTTTLQGQVPVYVKVTTNKAVKDWPEILAGYEARATALLDRLLHRSHVSNIKGRSYRLRDLLTVFLATSVGSTEATSFDEKPDTSGSPSGEVLQRFEVILSQNHLDAAWLALLGSGPAPHLAPPTHFESDRVIVHSVGSQPDECYAAEIQAVRAQGEAVVVEVIEREPVPNCVCTFALVEVFDVIRLDSKQGSATLCVRRPRLGC